SSRARQLRQSAIQRLIDLGAVEPNNDQATDDDHRTPHLTEPDELRYDARVGCSVDLFKLQSLLQKILFCFIARHSTRLRIDHDLFWHSSLSSLTRWRSRRLIFVLVAFGSRVHSSHDRYARALSAADNSRHGELRA